MGPVYCRWAKPRSLDANNGKEAINLGVRKFKGLSNQHKEKIKDCGDRKSRKRNITIKKGVTSQNIKENKTV